MRRKEKAREAARLRSVRWGFPPKRNTCRITFVSQRHNSLCSDHSSLRRDSQNITYTSIGKRVMKTDAKGWKVGGAKDDLRQFNHKSLVGLMLEMF